MKKKLNQHIFLAIGGLIPLAMTTYDSKSFVSQQNIGMSTEIQKC